MQRPDRQKRWSKTVVSGHVRPEDELNFHGFWEAMGSFGEVRVCSPFQRSVPSKGVERGRNRGPKKSSGLYIVSKNVSLTGGATASVPGTPGGRPRTFGPRALVGRHAFASRQSAQVWLVTHQLTGQSRAMKRMELLLLGEKYFSELTIFTIMHSKLACFSDFRNAPFLWHPLPPGDQTRTWQNTKLKLGYEL